ncbi:MAG: RHS repeat-associated core domain-containing protein, partial [Lachnospiraceae bacterium]|nr:RHS repeat-associated core domain-containing protein [Lachnospiraceae bacterium]
ETKNTAYEDVDGILAKNPFRYRGYYYDSETGWYYLQSRYYDPELKRFINADSTDLITCDYMSMMQYNLFAYCNDNPINKMDNSGRIPLANIPFLGVYIETKYTEYTGVTKEKHLGRNKYNNWGNNINDIYTYDSNTGERIIKDGWTEAKFTENLFHIHCSEEQQIGIIPEYLFNKKYLHENADGTSYEVVVCQLPSWLVAFDNAHDGDYIVVDKVNGGTFNFASHLSDPQGHTIYDVLPYFIWGN